MLVKKKERKRKKGRKKKDGKKRGGSRKRKRIHPGCQLGNRFVVDFPDI